MPNRFSPLMVGKTDEQLLTIARERDRYELEAYVAAIEELERRDRATPEITSPRSVVCYNGLKYKSKNI